MIRAKDQLSDEVTYPDLTKFLRSGGTLEIGESFSIGAFARIRKGNRSIVVDTEYRDLAAVLKGMDWQAKRYFEQEK